MKSYRVKVSTQPGKFEFLDVLARTSMDAAITACEAHNYLCSVSVVAQ